MGQESWCDLVPLIRLKSRYSLPIALKLSWEDPHSSSFMWLLAKISSSQTVGPKASVPRWLLAGGVPQILATWVPCRAAHNMRAGYHQNEQERASKMKSESFCKWNLESDTITFATFHALEGVTRFSSYLRGAHESQEVRITGKYLRGCVPHNHYLINSNNISLK